MMTEANFKTIIDSLVSEQHNISRDLDALNSCCDQIAILKHEFQSSELHAQDTTGNAGEAYECFGRVESSLHDARSLLESFISHCDDTIDYLENR